MKQVVMLIDESFNRNQWSSRGLNGNHVSCTTSGQQDNGQKYEEQDGG